MNYNIGDFINTNESLHTALIIDKNTEVDTFLISIKEYNGDYKWIFSNDIIEKKNLKSEEKLSILANFGEWFYESHKLLYQELIIENLAT
tara:strand:- start:3547 stop:3816 length:270 start_codon:yes stop_codon:yes gene_type:complete